MQSEEPTARRGCSTQGGANAQWRPIMAHVLNDPPELSLDSTLEESLLKPSTHPSVALPASARPADMTDPPVLVFAPAPTVPADNRMVPADPLVVTDRPAPRIRPQRRFRMDWYEAVVIILILSCAALGVYRLMWAIQP